MEQQVEVESREPVGVGEKKVDLETEKTKNIESIRVENKWMRRTVEAEEKKDPKTKKQEAVDMKTTVIEGMKITVIEEKIGQTTRKVGTIGMKTTVTEEEHNSNVLRRMNFTRWREVTNPYKEQYNWKGKLMDSSQGMSQVWCATHTPGGCR